VVIDEGLLTLADLQAIVNSPSSIVTFMKLGCAIRDNLI
jgi:hypothetical protein